MITLGIDTSNYTTSCAVYDSVAGKVIQRKKLLPVKEGEKGLRQSDAVFHHVQQLHPLMESLFSEFGGEIDAIGVSDRPRDAEGSYMPCFTVGVSVARSLSAVLKRPVYGFSHQSGHIMAALYSSDRQDLMGSDFIAFHVSGGTTEMLHITPAEDRIFKADIIGRTLDLNCGQAVDRAGVMLGLPFPCGKELEVLAAKSERNFNPRVCVKEGSCSLSGLENQCRKMLDIGEKPEDIAAFCLSFAGKTIEKMADYATEKYGNDIPLVFAGGVMSDRIIRNRIENKFNAFFAEPEFSCDNAAGTAILASVRGKTDA